VSDKDSVEAEKARARERISREYADLFAATSPEAIHRDKSEAVRRDESEEKPTRWGEFQWRIRMMDKAEFIWADMLRMDANNYVWFYNRQQAGIDIVEDLVLVLAPGQWKDIERVDLTGL
jgi:hypothetical protein